MWKTKGIIELQYCDQSDWDDNRKALYDETGGTLFIHSGCFVSDFVIDESKYNQSQIELFSKVSDGNRFNAREDVPIGINVNKLPVGAVLIIQEKPAKEVYQTLNFSNSASEFIDPFGLPCYKFIKACQFYVPVLFSEKKQCYYIDIADLQGEEAYRYQQWYIDRLENGEQIITSEPAYFNQSDLPVDCEVYSENRHKIILNN